MDRQLQSRGGMRSEKEAAVGSTCTTPAFETTAAANLTAPILSAALWKETGISGYPPGVRGAPTIDNTTTTDVILASANPL